MVASILFFIREMMEGIKFSGCFSWNCVMHFCFSWNCVMHLSLSLSLCTNKSISGKALGQTAIAGWLFLNGFQRKSIQLVGFQDLMVVLKILS